MKYKVGQRVRIREDHNVAKYLASGSYDPRFYDFLQKSILTVRAFNEHPKYGMLYEFEMPENITCWVKEEAIRALKSKKKPVKVLGEVEQLDKIALNFREG
jgi:hypothetical protein